MTNERYSEPELLHTDVYMPLSIMKSALTIEGQIKDYSNTKHFIERYNDRTNYKHYMTEEMMLKALDSIRVNQTRPFEIEVKYDFKKNRYIVTKYVVRVSYDNDRDVSFAIIPLFDMNTHTFIGKIKTAWLNNKEDIHYTLDDSKYIKSLAYTK